MSAGYQLNTPTVAAEEVDGEVIAINMATGVYVSMVGWSAWAWHALSGGTDPADVGRALMQVSTDADAEVDRFVAALREDRLLVPASGGADTASLRPVPDQPFTGLELERFTDMEDLILLDPVHDVDEAEGWPRAATHEG